MADDVEVIEQEIRKAIEYQHHVGVALIVGVAITCYCIG